MTVNATTVPIGHTFLICLKFYKILIIKIKGRICFINLIGKRTQKSRSMPIMDNNKFAHVAETNDGNKIRAALWKAMKYWPENAR